MPLYSMLCLLLVASCISYVLSEKMLDMSYDLAADSMRWVTHPKFNKTTLQRGYTEGGYWIEAYQVEMSEHTSTHIDAPSHFAYGKLSVDQIPLSSLVAPAVVIDITDKTARDARAQLTSEDVTAWLEEHGPLPHGALVFVRTGWGSRYGDALRYYGTDTDDVSKLIFPGIHVSAAKLIANYEATSGRRVSGVGLDTASLDGGGLTTDASVHRVLFERNIYGLENVANLDKLPVTGASVTVLPLKVRGGSGGPCRLLATLPDGAIASVPQRSPSIFASTLVLLLWMR